MPSPQRAQASRTALVPASPFLTRSDLSHDSTHSADVPVAPTPLPQADIERRSLLEHGAWRHAEAMAIEAAARGGEREVKEAKDLIKERIRQIKSGQGTSANLVIQRYKESTASPPPASSLNPFELREKTMWMQERAKLLKTRVDGCLAEREKLGVWREKFRYRYGNFRADMAKLEESGQVPDLDVEKYMPELQ
ncbi:hypothetical protein BOTBODRAFT_180953 [Botryobasidium botryosum FD-172 SS1]|uniref:Uncharacterized protein n=1 Tax=Botryobasidium botryosum (strain FD-172 SS1) TaxID=930990 RepID=A0A067M5G9_BOTB1|nr:hypothetical protein BOTBODRAFT_180953 [Botryobasidium botryosum FD-172 SS1]